MTYPSVNIVQFLEQLVFAHELVRAAIYDTKYDYQQTTRCLPVAVEYIRRMILVVLHTLPPSPHTPSHQEQLSLIQVYRLRSDSNQETVTLGNRNYSPAEKGDSVARHDALVSPAR